MEVIDKTNLKVLQQARVVLIEQFHDGYKISDGYKSNNNTLLSDLHYFRLKLSDAIETIAKLLQPERRFEIGNSLIMQVEDKDVDKVFAILLSIGKFSGFSNNVFSISENLTEVLNKIEESGIKVDYLYDSYKNYLASKVASTVSMKAAGISVNEKEQDVIEKKTINPVDYPLLTQQTCKKCGRKQRFEYVLADSIWQRLPEKWHNKCLCIECFIEEMEKMFVHHVRFDKDEFKFLAIVGDKVHCTIKEEV